MKPSEERPQTEVDDVAAEANWDGFWKKIIAPTGKVDMRQVKRELNDYYRFLENAAKVFDHVTGGIITKQNTDADAIIQLSDERERRAMEVMTQIFRDEVHDLIYVPNSWICDTCGNIEVRQTEKEKKDEKKILQLCGKCNALMTQMTYGRACNDVAEKCRLALDREKHALAAAKLLLRARGCWCDEKDIPEIPEHISGEFDMNLDDARVISEIRIPSP